MDASGTGAVTRVSVGLTWVAWFWFSEPANRNSLEFVGRAVPLVSDRTPLVEKSPPTLWVMSARAAPLRGKFRMPPALTGTMNAP